MIVLLLPPEPSVGAVITESKDKRDERMAFALPYTLLLRRDSGSLFVPNMSGSEALSRRENGGHFQGSVKAAQRQAHQLYLVTVAGLCFASFLQKLGEGFMTVHLAHLTSARSTSGGDDGAKRQIAPEW